MRRWILRIFVSLLLGAIVNVAVAWGCAVWVPLRDRPGTTRMYLVSAQEKTWWAQWAPASIASRPVLSSGAEAWGLIAHYVSADRTSGLLTIEAADDGRIRGIIVTYPPDIDPMFAEVVRFDHALLVRSGWPMKSMRGARWITGKGQGGATELNDALGQQPAPSAVTMVSAIEYERRAKGIHEFRILPIGIDAAGFAINTVFYAAILWLLVAAPFALRRRRRIKRGLCPKCAYDLRGSDSTACPECGATHEVKA